jgi:putative hydrolase of the HAD superfamily
MQTTPHIRAITFDAAGTLIRVADPVGETYARIARDVGATLSPAALDAAFRDLFPCMPALAFPDLDQPALDDAERAWWRNLVARVVQRAGGVREFDAYFEALYAHYADAAAWRAYPETHGVLKRARAGGLRVGVVSNFDSRLAPILRQLGIGDLVDTVIHSTGCGAAKPDERIFRFAMQALATTPQTTLHVGDSLQADYHGAHAAGMTAVHLCRDKKRSAADIPTIRHLDEIDTFLALHQ